jgi:secreted trypsin-like serine protease
MMRKAIFSALGLLISSFSYASDDVSSYIVNGSSASTTTFTSFASLFYDSIEYNGVYGSSSFCGATMLTDQYVLTAAHCIFDGEGNPNYEYMLFTVVGQTDDESDFPDSVETVRASEFYYYSSFSDSSSDLWADDIAIIKLESSLNISGTVNRASDETYRDASNTFIAVGHGKTDSSTNGTELLQAQVNFVEKDTCKAAFTDGDQLTDKQICFSGDYDASTGLYNGVCSGDSGGPVYYSDGSTYTQVGITSFGPTTCGTGTVTGVFTEITDYSSWIDSVISGSETPNYIATDAKRQAYIDSDSSLYSSSSSGGSMGFGVLLGCAGLLFARRLTRIKQQ